MGKKDKNKKKGLGAAKTAEKTEKKLRNKLKKETGEDDIESIVKAIENEEKKRKEVKEIQVDPPSHRSNFSMTSHPENPEIIFFGGEFYNGQKTLLFNDLLFYNTKRQSWSQVKSPSGPPPRCSHQAVITGGKLWVFGGEYVSPSETQFYHYKDLWCYHFASRRWEKIAAPGGPSARSGHRMVLFRRHLVVFGGFHDNLRECRYFNDVHAFDLDALVWRKIEVGGGTAPCPRSGCVMYTLPDSRGIIVFGGYCKEKAKKDAEKGMTLTDMFLLVPDKHQDPSGFSQVRWHPVKQVGMRPSPRSGMSATVASGSNKVFLFGGVQDVKEDEEDLEGKFFNELYTVHVENEKASWLRVELTGKKEGERKARRRTKEDGESDDDDEDGAQQGNATQQLEDMSLEDPKSSTVTVEEGAFTVTSTVNLDDDASTSASGTASATASSDSRAPFAPPPRFGAGLAVKQGKLYAYGGMVEDGDVTYTLKDFYSIDVNKLNEWTTLVESDLKSMEWIESDSSSDSDDEESEDDMEEG